MEIFQVAFDAFGVAVVMGVVVIVLVVCLRVLPEMGFDGFSKKVLAVCVAVLSAMGLLMFRPGRAPEGASEPWPDYFILLPYAALGLTLLLLPLLLFLFWCFRRFKECFHRERRPYQRTKEWPVSLQPKPPATKDDRTKNRRDRGDRQMIHRADRDRIVPGKRRFRQ
jgi:hypothetical protein